MELNTLERKEPYKKLIIALSILIPSVIALLFGMPKIRGYDFSFLPPIYASINGITALVLIAAVMAIKNQKRVLHQRLINLCIFLSTSFLTMYVIYHITSESTSFGGTGVIRYFYLFILITHILFSVIVIPFVLFTYMWGFTANFEKHKALAKFTFPLWLYVAVTGVIVYLMIRPYYQ